MGIVSLAGRASGKGRAAWRWPPVRLTRGVGIIHECPQFVDIHAQNGHKPKMLTCKMDVSRTGKSAVSAAQMRRKIVVIG
jgi:hypothetical protein